MAVTVDKQRCPQSHDCPLVAVCPVEAISQQGHGLPSVDPERCIECGLCVEQCPMQAMRFAGE